MVKRLYRSRTNCVIAGVCGGLGEYLGIDAAWVRLFFVLLALGDGAGVLIYLVLWLVIPREGEGAPGTRETFRAGAGEIGERARTLGEDLRENLRPLDPRTGVVIGGAMIILGAAFLLKALDLAWLQWLSFRALWPVFVIAAGVLLLWRQFKGG